MAYKPQLPDLSLGLISEGVPVYRKLNFFPDNLYYAYLTIRPTKEPRMVEGKNFLCDTSVFDD